MKTIESKKITWLDIKEPKEEDIEFLRENFDFHPLILEELMPPSVRSKVEAYDGYLYLVFYFPVFDKKTRQTRPRELDILVTKDTLITSHYQSILPLKALFDQCNLYDEAKEKFMNKNAGYLLYYLIDQMLSACLPKLDHITENIEKIEEDIFRGKEKEMVNEISIVKRDILNLSKALKPQKSILESLILKGPELLGKRLKVYLRDLLGDYERVWNNLSSQKEMIDSLQETNESLLSHKISEIIKILTIVSFITFPLAVVAGIFGMNVFANIGFINWPYTFWAIIGIMMLSALIMFAVFKKKRWL